MFVFEYLRNREVGILVDLGVQIVYQWQEVWEGGGDWVVVIYVNWLLCCKFCDKEGYGDVVVQMCDCYVVVWQVVCVVDGYCVFGIFD